MAITQSQSTKHGITKVALTNGMTSSSGKVLASQLVSMNHATMDHLPGPVMDTIIHMDFINTMSTSRNTSFNTGCGVSVWCWSSSAWRRKRISTTMTATPVPAWAFHHSTVANFGTISTGHTPSSSSAMSTTKCNKPKWAIPVSPILMILCVVKTQLLTFLVPDLLLVAIVTDQPVPIQFAVRLRTSTWSQLVQWASRHLHGLTMKNLPMI